MNMVSIKLSFRPSKVIGKPGTLYFRLIHNRIMREIGTSYKLYSDEWENGHIKFYGSGTERYRYLFNVQNLLQKDIHHLETIINRMEQSGKPYSVDSIVYTYKSLNNSLMSFCGFVNATTQHLRNIGKLRLAETYTTSMNSFLRFRGDKGDVFFDEMDADLIKEYEAYLMEDCGLNLNTVSFYMRNLRAIYNRAVEKELTESRNLFNHVYTGVRKTVKRAISSEVIQRIKKLDLTMFPILEESRDYFLLSFYLRGISFVDLSYLKMSDLQNGCLKYLRHKTNQLLTIKWEAQMQEIVNRYHVAGSPYLLPIINVPGVGERRQYQNGLHRINAHLKIIGKLVGCPIKLTTYCARHGWASIARSMNIPLSIISESMGHTSESTTRIYLASLDNVLIDDANKMIIDTI